MNSFDFLQQLNGISPEYIEESLSADIQDGAVIQQSLTASGTAEQITVSAKAAPKHERSIFRTVFAYVSLAACVMLAVGAAFLFRRLHGDDLLLLESSRTEETVITSLPTVTATTMHSEAATQSSGTVTSTAAAESATTSGTQTLSSAEWIVTATSQDTEPVAEITQAVLTQDTLPEITEITKTTAEPVRTTEPESQPAVTESVQTTEPPVTDHILSGTNFFEASETTTFEATTTAEHTTTAQTAPISEVYALGDLDSDGLLTEADGAILYCITAREASHGIRFVSDELFVRADLNTDGVVNYADQVALMRYLALFWYGDCRDVTITDYLDNLSGYNERYLELDKAGQFPADIFKPWNEAAWVLTINEKAMDKESTLTYENRSAESEEALESVRSLFRAML